MKSGVKEVAREQNAVVLERYIVGLTGGIGSGKSAAAQRFVELGAAVVDTDVIARELTDSKGAAMPAIRRTFGQDFIDENGALDRAVMRRKIFSDAEAKRCLEAILHPMIREESDRRCHEANAPYVVLVVPLLVESGQYRDRVQRVLLVDCDESTQVARVVMRNGLSVEEVHAIISTQASRQTRVSAADDVVDNSGSIEMLHRQIDDLHRVYLEKAAVS